MAQDVDQAEDQDHPLLVGLDEAQRAAVTCTRAPLCILAGAGSGKTRVLTRRVAWRVATDHADARHVLALTFTRKAAGELTARLRRLGVGAVAAGTFHAIAYAQLRRRWADRGQTAPAVLDRKGRLLAPLLPHRRPASLQVGDVAAEIEWAKARMVRPEAYELQAERAGRRPPLPAPDLASVFARYEAEKRRRGLVDFDDLLLLCGEALECDREFAASQRWRFRHLFVDEFQDVNPAQHRLLEAWRGDRLDLCVVGDPNQAIYAWNGADAGYLLGFRERFPGGRILYLDDNYRSSPQVLAVANAVLGSSVRATSPMRATQPDGPLPTVRSYPTDLEEARGVARLLRERHAPTSPWSHMAVLTRTNAQLVVFEESLRARQIPYRVRGEGAFLKRPEIREALADLRRRPRGWPLATALPDLEEAARAARSEPAETVSAGVDERGDELDALVRLATDHAAADPDATVESFVAWLVATVRADEPDAGQSAVELATFHAAKGLEWPIVFLGGLERGLVPSGLADTTEARAEERRLLYVAATRASSELHCSWAERRTFGTRTLTRTPSPYLDTIQAAIRAVDVGTADWRRFLEEPRARLRASRGHRDRTRIQVGREADPELLAALKAWRARAARASGVPAFVIFHDTTLAAVAEARPADRPALLALPGMGPVKAERYGDAILAVLAAHARSAS